MRLCRDVVKARVAGTKTFTTSADFAVDSAQVPVTRSGGHGNVIGRLIFGPDFLH